MADLPCPTCGSTLAFLEQYHRYYCHRCGQYAPEGYGDRGAQHCPTCGGILSYVAQYDRFYCYRCNAYAALDAGTAAKPAPSAETPSAAATGSPAPTAATSSSTAITPATTTAEATLVAAATPAPLPASPQPSSEPAPKASPATPQPTAEVPSTPASGAAPAEKPAEDILKEPSLEMLTLAHSKPGVVRVKIFALKKSELMDLCKAYSLDPVGTKEQLQERLLSYLHDLEGEEQPEVEPEPKSAPIAAPESAKATPVATSAPTSAAPSVVEVVEEPKPEPAPVAQAAAAPMPVVAVAPTETVETPHPAARAEHPCPTCGHEISPLDLVCWFCGRPPS